MGGIGCGALEAIPGDCDPCGDMNNDHMVDEDDFALFLAAYGRSEGDPLFNACGDFDGDGSIGMFDYQSWLQCYREFVGDPAAPAPDPGMQGDYDADHNVDLVDFGYLQACWDGDPELRIPCVLKFDFDGSGTLDPVGFASFEAVLAGPAP